VSHGPAGFHIRLTLSYRTEKCELALHKIPHSLSDQKGAGALHLDRQFIELADRLRIERSPQRLVLYCA
jgi:hypothetical protein